MTKLLMLITSLAGGGAERVASELSLNLSPNIEQKIVTLTDKISYPSKEPPLSMGIKFQKPLVLSIILAFFLGTIKYKRLLKTYKPDVSLSFLTLDNFINIISNYGNQRTKTIISVHIALSMKFGNSLFDILAKILIKFLYNRADRIIAVSDGVKNELISDFYINPSLIEVIHNPLDVKKIQRLAKEDIDDEKWFNEKIPILINVGRLTKQKGQWHLIRAFSEVRKQKECRLVIRGSGDLKSYLETLVNNLNLSNDVLFLEWKDNPYKYISKGFLFVSSSLWEALPYALTESLACGCPIISTDCKYGPKEIIGENRYGILVPSMDENFHKASELLTVEEKYLSKTILKLLDDLELRNFYSKKSLERASDYDTNKCMQKYENLFTIMS